MKVSLDARRLLCPLPVIRVQEKMGQLHAGDQLQLICTDPGTLQDIPAWCRVQGHSLIAQRQEGDEYHFLLQAEETEDE
ncbi:sulfurtransferase TusA family protein [Magnetovirga frankeli]|uniref:sulfurtransferase TusA family protein n=1 Tax=Magnetovirga frankeli TaxID=947516 RepID=UPI003D32C8FA